ncbi:MAG: Rho GTPase activation protein [Benjaminiella poitrasii]|nr:MAG: Rho GTPase activation protein [Benjaminiella poitrasii]
MSMDDKRVNSVDPPTSPLPSQSNRIERFMKRHLNKAEDPITKLESLRIETTKPVNLSNVKVHSPNHHTSNSMQSPPKGKSDKVKEMLQSVLKTDIHQLHQKHQLVQSPLNIDSALDTKHFNDFSVKSSYMTPKSAPAHLQNHDIDFYQDFIFGISLTEYAQRRNRSPPLLITKCIDAIERLGGLEKEGIYRVPGKQSNIEKLRRAFELNEDTVIIGQNDVPEDIFSIASIVKKFLRELRTPLFPFKLTDRLVYSKIPDQELRLMNLLTRLLKLPPANYDTLKALIEHLVKLQTYVDKNKMTVTNLTLIFTPAIFQDMNHAQSSPGGWSRDCVLEDLINNYHDIFANKDLHNNSAITGDIEYGFGSPQSTVESMVEHSKETHSSNNYALLDDEKVILVSNDSCIYPPPPFPPPPALTLSCSLPTQQQLQATEKKNYKAHFQEKGLKLNTVPKNKPTIVLDDYNSLEIPISIKSAVVPSHDWLQLDSENDPNDIPPVPKLLRRSATTGKKVLSRRKHKHFMAIDNDAIPALPVLNNSSSAHNISSSTTIPSA